MTYLDDFADRLRKEHCPRIGWKTIRNLRWAGVNTEEDWLKGEWRWESRGIGPGLEAIINTHIGKEAGFPWKISPPEPPFFTYITSPVVGIYKPHAPVFHYTDYRMAWKRWFDRDVGLRRETYVVAALCGQTPAAAQYSRTSPDGHPFCKLCSVLIDKEAAKH